MIAEGRLIRHKIMEDFNYSLEYYQNILRKNLNYTEREIFESTALQILYYRDT